MPCCVLSRSIESGDNRIFAIDTQPVIPKSRSEWRPKSEKAPAGFSMPGHHLKIAASPPANNVQVRMPNRPRCGGRFARLPTGVAKAPAKLESMPSACRISSTTLVQKCGTLLTNATVSPSKILGNQRDVWFIFARIPARTRRYPVPIATRPYRSEGDVFAGVEWAPTKQRTV
jgi:hypothetical protein